MKCQATSVKGTQCRANARKGHQTCLLHSDGAAQRLGSKGGLLARKHRHAARARRRLAMPRTIGDVRQCCGRLAQELYRDKLSAKTANAIVAALRLLVESIKADEFEQRLEKLEAMAATRARSGRTA